MIIPEQAVAAVKETYIRFGWGGRAGSEELIRAALAAAEPLMGVNTTEGWPADAIDRLIDRLETLADHGAGSMADAQEVAADAWAAIRALRGPSGAQRPEDVARAHVFVRGKLNEGPWVTDSQAEQCAEEIVAFVLALPHTGQPGDAFELGYNATLALTASHTAQPQEGDRVSFPRWWVQQTYESLKAIDTANVPGHPGDVIFLLRDMLGDALSASPLPVAESGWREILKFARRAAFLGAHINDREDGADVLARELHRLYDAVTDFDGEEPDLTFCCGCGEEIEIANGQEQWVLDGVKYHKDCYKAALPAPPHIADQRREGK